MILLNFVHSRRQISLEVSMKRILYIISPFRIIFAAGVLLGAYVCFLHLRENNENAGVFVAAVLFTFALIAIGTDIVLRDYYREWKKLYIAELVILGIAVLLLKRMR